MQLQTAIIYKYPEIDSYSDDEVDDCPWSVSLDVYGGAVLMSILWSRVEEVQSFVKELAAKHGLICFDPQNDELSRIQVVSAIFCSLKKTCCGVL